MYGWTLQNESTCGSMHNQTCITNTLNIKWRISCPSWACWVQWVLVTEIALKLVLTLVNGWHLEYLWNWLVETSVNTYALECVWALQRERSCGVCYILACRVLTAILSSCEYHVSWMLVSSLCFLNSYVDVRTYIQYNRYYYAYACYVTQKL